MDGRTSDSTFCADSGLVAACTADMAREDITVRRGNGRAVWRGYFAREALGVRNDERCAKDRLIGDKRLIGMPRQHPVNAYKDPSHGYLQQEGVDAGVILSGYINSMIKATYSSQSFCRSPGVSPLSK
jgi:hypothetical protein